MTVFLEVLMGNWFDEKAQQLDTEAVTAFGIPLMTRYGKAHELEQMLGFVRGAAERGLERHVKRVFFDSKADLCTIDFVADHVFGSEVDRALRECADQSLAQFQWGDTIHHGAALRSWLEGSPD